MGVFFCKIVLKSGNKPVAELRTQPIIAGIQILFFEHKSIISERALFGTIF